MKIGQGGIDLIKQFEGFRAAPYVCPAGKITIGYGSTMYEDGSAVKLTDPSIDDAKAVALMQVHLEKRVYGALTGFKLNQNQFDTICDFIYNLGAGNFAVSRLKEKMQKDPNDPSIADELRRWVYSNHKIEKGLQRRREAEIQLYFSPIK